MNSSTTVTTTVNMMRAAVTRSTRASTSTRTLSTAAAASAATAPKSPRTTLRPHPVVLGPTQLNRYQEHYRNTLSTDLLYMTYDPAVNLETPLPPSSSTSPINPTSPSSIGDLMDRQRSWDAADPYTANRPQRPARGNRRLSPLTKPLSPHNTMNEIPKLEKIILTCFSKDAIANKQNLVPLIAQMRAITGLSVQGSLSDPSLLASTSSSISSSSSANANRGHIEIIRAKSGVASFKLRPGMPVGVKAILPGPIAHEFLEILTTFVLPRLRSFGGFALPPASQPAASPAAMSGVVSLGMHPEAIPLFPQIEINLDQYPNKPLGFQIDCITNQRGRKATEKARALLSGFGVPFVRRGDM
ncbi:related to 60S ribosomal protein L7, mitochondrial [Melanopsichium pennsylvanicum]|uniref:Related to 60S ribosomal protein L7, mitochondrial n=2 Tax=Melanopsichium pennsylvanicum TaxID=63383 RepID=A0AAJ4XJ40_9BASI|nr:related to 60s ribosomal protein l7, mitochondrial precursor [Melanopsichium pennsylvanicum 4]SNX82631.1 related to 60S ribosomal protein L7, mitochondrial [Melanopsichium pennsylvanicum]